MNEPIDDDWRMLADAAEEMRLAYNRAFEKHGNTNPVLEDLRWAIGHLALAREFALADKPAVVSSAVPDHPLDGYAYDGCDCARCRAHRDRPAALSPNREERAR